MVSEDFRKQVSGYGLTTTDEVALGSDSPAAGLTVDSVVVTAADVEITRELRRLVGGP